MFVKSWFPWSWFAGGMYFTPLDLLPLGPGVGTGTGFGRETRIAAIAQSGLVPIQ